MDRKQAPVAQLDRALPSEGRGQRFELNLVKPAQLKQSIKSQQNQWNPTKGIGYWLFCQICPEGLQGVFGGLSGAQLEQQSFTSPCQQPILHLL